MSLTACEKEIFNRILKEELVPATGCTEPVAIAYAAAAAKKALGCEPEVCEAELSGNIIKNARCVAVPNTGGLKGIEAAVAAGVVAGRAELALDVLSAATGREEEIRDFLEKRGVSVRPADNDLTFFIRVTVGAGSSRAKAVIEGFHTNLVLIEKDGIELFRSGAKSNPCCVADRSMLTVEKIVEFADVADLAEIREILERQIAFNSAISEEGLKGDWGANVGKVILKTFGDSPESRLKAVAAAGSDARMGGCEAGNHSVGQRQSGHNRKRARSGICKAESRRQRKAFARADSCRPYDHTSENGHRPPVRLLRGGKRGLRSRRGHSVSQRRRIFRNSPHGRKRARRLFGNDMRRSQALLRRQNSRRG